MMKITKPIIAAALMCSAMFSTGCGKLTEIDPFDEQYLSYQLSGISGYTGRADFDQTKAPSGLTTFYRPEYNTPLSNGDTIHVTVYPQQSLKEDGYKVSRTEIDYVVSGLEEIPDELPEDVANSIMDALKQTVLDENAEYVYEVGDEVSTWASSEIVSVGEPQLVRGLYEVTTDSKAEDSLFKNEDDEDTDYNRHPPIASFKALWSITYEAKYTEDARYIDIGEVKAGEVFTKTDLFYASIDDFTIKDGKLHYAENADPYCIYYNDMQDRDYTEYVKGFDSLSDKEHLATVEY